MEFTIDELTALVLQHTRRAKHARKSAAELMALADEDDKLALVYLEAGKRVNREDEERESKMNIRRIISGISMFILVCFFAMGSLTLAQDATLVTNTPQVAATAEVTPEPVVAPVSGNNTQVNLLIDALKELVLIGALIALAFKTAGLVTPEVMDKAMARGFDLAKGLADTTPTPIDNQLLEIAQPIISKLIADELAKRNVTATLYPTTSPQTATQPITTTTIVG